MPGADVDTVRGLVTMERVLNLLGFEPSSRSGAQWYGSCPLDDARGWSPASLVLGERGDRSLNLPSVPPSRQPA